MWTNLVVASTAFVVLHIAAFVFLAGSAARVYAIRARTRHEENWEQFAEKVGDPDKRKILRGAWEAMGDAVVASIVWRTYSLHAVVVINLYALGIMTGLMGFALSGAFSLALTANPLFLVSVFALFASLLLSTTFISSIFLRLFRALKMRKS